jgi:hypothetical protein
MGVVGMVKAFLEAVGEIFNPAPEEKPWDDRYSASPDTLQSSDKFYNPGDWFWKEVLEQKIEENEQVREMMIDDYESRHEAEAVQENLDKAEAEEGASDAGSVETDSEHGIDDSSAGSGGYDGYIG